MKLNQLLLLKKILVALGVINFVLFGLPILGLYSVFSFAQSIGCKISAADSQECLFLGIDIGERLYSYSIPIIGSILTPIAFVYSFWDLILVWYILLYYISYNIKNVKNGR